MKNNELKDFELGQVVAGAGAQPPEQGGGSIGDSPNVDVDVDPV